MSGNITRRESGTAFAVAIPDDCSLVGASLSSQALSTDGVALLVTNALDITIGTF